MPTCELLNPPAQLYKVWLHEIDTRGERVELAHTGEGLGALFLKALT